MSHIPQPPSNTTTTHSLSSHPLQQSYPSSSHDIIQQHHPTNNQQHHTEQPPPSSHNNIPSDTIMRPGSPVSGGASPTPSLRQQQQQQQQQTTSYVHGTSSPQRKKSCESPRGGMGSPRGVVGGGGGSPRAPRTNRAAQVRLQSKQRSLSATESGTGLEVSPRPLSRGRSAHNTDTPSRYRQNRSSNKRANMKEERQEYEEVPKLPLPSLQQILDQYLDNLKPILDEKSYGVSKSNVEQYCQPGGVGEKAHQHLEERRETEANWAYQYWLKDMYLGIRLPLPVNSNPGMVFPRISFRKPEDILSWTSRAVAEFCKYKDRLDNRYILQDQAATREPGQPMCMAQYFRLMTSYRAPGKEMDQIISSGEEPKESEHIIIMRRGTMYSLPVKQSGKWKKLEDIYSSMLDIIEDTETSDIAPLEDRIGVVSASDRTTWGEVYENLMSDESNKENLLKVQSSLLIVCFDEECQNNSDVNRSMKDMFRQMLTGSGSKFNGTNRWFDKTMQLVVGKDGVCGLCYEHSVSEGIVPVQIIQDLIQKLGENWKNSIAYHPDSVHFKKLTWNLDDTHREAIHQAIQVLDNLDSDNDLEVFRFTHYGKDFIKSSRCSPDAWIQLSLQLTIYRMYGHLVPTYESASTRRFRLGRVDSIRSAHPEAAEFCEAMMQDYSKQEKRKYFENAMKKQTKVMVDNILGYGLDVPLLGLREATKELGLWDKQSLFTDPAYTSHLNFLLSTSQVPVNLESSFMGYGAVVPDGYGVSYNPYTSSIIFNICSFHSSKKSNSRTFANQLQKSLLELKQLFVK